MNGKCQMNGIRWSLAVLSSVALMGTGCVSINSYTSARVLEAGSMETSVRSGLTKAAFSIDGQAVDLPVVPTMDVGLRYGVNGKADVGFAFGTGRGLTFEGRFQLYDDKKLAVALHPTVGGLFIGGINLGGGYAVLDLPLVIGLMMGPDSELVLTPKVAVRSAVGSFDGASANANIVIPSLGLGLKLGLGPSLHLYPELSIGSSRSNGGSSNGSFSENLGPVVNVGLGVGFGGKYRK